MNYNLESFVPCRGLVHLQVRYVNYTDVHFDAIELFSCSISIIVSTITIEQWLLLWFTFSNRLHPSP